MLYTVTLEQLVLADNFYKRLNKSTQPALAVWSHKKILWTGRAGKHRPAGIF